MSSDPQVNPKLSKFEIIENPNKIKLKAKPLPGRSADSMLKKANSAVAEMSGDFELIYSTEIELLAREIDHARQDPIRVGEAIDKIRNSLHDLRGQAGTFGFPLVSKIADSGCKYIDRQDNFGIVELTVLGVHVDGLRAVKHEALRGDGGPLGQKLLKGIVAVIKKHEPA
ncbi:MAG: hypothetical protein HOL85_00385 [Rhodospirillaceae bacterium]|nr:hypothetical protein [Rhodospirillaceae bacterium]MBT6135917.1 hypothetical protein [Rhodospirillaceae bacterium]